MSKATDILTIERNDAFQSRPSEAERDKFREKWQHAVARSQLSAAKAALSLEENESKPGDQVYFLIEAFIEQLDLDAERMSAELRNLFSSPVTLTELLVGRATYPFRKNAVAAFVPEYKTLVLAGLQSVDLRGYGDSPEDAQRDLAQRLHITYQRLVRMLPAELSKDDSFTLNTIKEFIDLRQHEDLTPTTLRKIGIVTSRSPFRIKWWGDDNDFEADLSTSPCQLAAFEVDDWFDAAVEYDRKHRQILQILTVQRLPPRAEKPYDDGQLAQEIMELEKISPDDI